MHDALIAVVRRPAFYLHFGSPDTFDGRFDLLVLMASVLLRRLRSGDVETQNLAQAIVDTLFRRLDIALRELGVSDVAVPKRMKRLAEAFKGRTAAYDHALEAGDEGELAAAIARNVLNGSSDGRDLARYMIAANARLHASDLSELRGGHLPFPEADLAAGAKA